MLPQHPLSTVWRWLIAWGTLPGTLIAGVFVGYRLLVQGVQPSLAAGGVVFAVAIFLFVLERLHPWEPRWRLQGRELAVDLVHSLLWHGALPGLLRGVLWGTLIAGASLISGWAGGKLWPGHWPLLLQLGLALAVGEFFAYWIHRLCHERPNWWRIHALHHSSDHLYVLSSGRNHPFNVTVSVLAQFAPLILLGVPPELMALHGLFTGLHGLLQHANIKLRCDGLNWVLSSPDLHYWHHSREISESNANYGSNLIVWDVLFGTRHLPSRSRPSQLGLQTAFPRTFVNQLLSPFLFEKETGGFPLNSAQRSRERA